MEINPEHVDVVIAAGTLRALMNELDHLRGERKGLQAENTRLVLENQNLRAGPSSQSEIRIPKSEIR
jgi:cell division protein FtsL